jgi:putative acetyltransferase
MYLRRDYRAKGLGRQLLEHALAEARRLGFGTITLETASVLKEAIRLYECYGFKPYVPTHLSCRCDQAYTLELK